MTDGIVNDITELMDQYKDWADMPILRTSEVRVETLEGLMADINQEHKRLITQLQSPPPLGFEEAVALAEERDTWFTRPHFDGTIVMLSGITGAKVTAGSRLARAFKEGIEVQIDRIFMHCSPDKVARSWWPTAADSEATDWVVGLCVKR